MIKNKNKIKNNENMKKNREKAEEESSVFCRLTGQCLSGLVDRSLVVVDGQTDRLEEVRLDTDQ